MLRFADCPAHQQRKSHPDKHELPVALPKVKCRRPERLVRRFLTYTMMQTHLAAFDNV